MKKVLSSLLLSSLASFAFSQMTMVRSEFRADVYAQGAALTRTMNQPTTLEVGDMFGRAFVDSSQQYFESYRCMFKAQSSGGKGFDPLPLGSTMRIRFEFSITEHSGALFNLGTRSPVLAGDGARNSITAILNGPTGELLRIERRNVVTDSDDFAHVTSMVPGQYLLEITTDVSLSGTVNQGQVSIEQNSSITIYTTPVPEPTSLAVLTLGLAALRRRRHSRP